MDAAMARVAGELIINHIEQAITDIFEEQTRIMARQKQQDELAEEMHMLQQMKTKEEKLKKEVENEYLLVSNLQTEYNNSHLSSQSRKGSGKKYAKQDDTYE